MSLSTCTGEKLNALEQANVRGRSRIHKSNFACCSSARRRRVDTCFDEKKLAREIENRLEDGTQTNS